MRRTENEGGGEKAFFFILSLQKGAFLPTIVILPCQGGMDHFMAWDYRVYVSFLVLGEHKRDVEMVFICVYLRSKNILCSSGRLHVHTLMQPGDKTDG